MRPFSSMTQLVVLPVKVSAESFTTDCTSIASFFGFCWGGFEDFRPIYHLRVESSHMSARLEGHRKVVSRKTHLSKSA